MIAKVGIRTKGKTETQAHPNNNRTERMNDTLRERVKVTRGWKTMEKPSAEGQRIHYNFVKPHASLEGMTPAQRAGLAIPDNWMVLLEQALKGKKA